jgi:acyl-CoA hydrolase
MESINFYTRKWVRPEDLNSHGTLFGGSLLRWIDDEAVVYAVIQLGNPRVVTKYLSEIDFVSSARLGDIVEIGLVATQFGRTSVSMRAEVRNLLTGEQILTIDRLVFVGLDAGGAPLPHGYTELTRGRERLAHLAEG